MWNFDGSRFEIPKSMLFQKRTLRLSSSILSIVLTVVCQFAFAGPGSGGGGGDTRCVQYVNLIDKLIKAVQTISNPKIDIDTLYENYLNLRCLPNHNQALPLETKKSSTSLTLTQLQPKLWIQLSPVQKIAQTWMGICGFSGGSQACEDTLKILLLRPEFATDLGLNFNGECEVGFSGLNILYLASPKAGSLSENILSRFHALEQSMFVINSLANRVLRQQGIFAKQTRGIFNPETIPNRVKFVLIISADKSAKSFKMGVLPSDKANDLQNNLTSLQRYLFPTQYSPLEISMLVNDLNKAITDLKINCINKALSTSGSQ